MIKISVIIPVYNLERYIKKCLESLIDQGLDRNKYEILIVDDCSMDKTLEIIEEFTKIIDLDIRVIKNKKKLGPGGSRNVGINVSKGEFLFFIDGDDWIESKALLKFYDKIREGTIDIVVGTYQYVNLEKTILKKIYFDNYILDGGEIYNKILKGKIPCHVWNKLYRKKIFIENGIQFPEINYFEDVATLPRIFSKGLKVGFLEDVTYNYLQRPGSITKSISWKKIYDRFKVFEKLEEEVSDKDFLNHLKLKFGIIDTYLDSILRSNLKDHLKIVNILNKEIKEIKIKKIDLELKEKVILFLLKSNSIQVVSFYIMRSGFKIKRVIQMREI